MHHETNMYLRRNKREERTEKYHLRDDQRYVLEILMHKLR